LGRPAAKRSYAEAKAAEKGRLQAHTEHEAQTFSSSKKTMVWVKQFFEKHVSQIPKGIAIIGVTYIVKGLIDTDEQLRAKYKVFKALTTGVEKATGLPFSYLFSALESFGIPVGLMATQFIPGEMLPEETMTEELLDWIIAFSLAYIIVEHAGQIIVGLGEGVKALSGILGFLLG